MTSITEYLLIFVVTFWFIKFVCRPILSLCCFAWVTLPGSLTNRKYFDMDPFFEQMLRVGTCM